MTDHESILEEFAGSLSRAARWRRENFPEIETPEGFVLLIWLLKHEQERRSLGDFYASSHLSTPTMRKAIKAFTARDLATVEFSKNDTRLRFIRCTRKLTALAEAYSRVLALPAVNSQAKLDTRQNPPTASEPATAPKNYRECDPQADLP